MLTICVIFRSRLHGMSEVLCTSTRAATPAQTIRCRSPATVFSRQESLCRIDALAGSNARTCRIVPLRSAKRDTDQIERSSEAPEAIIFGVDVPESRSHRTTLTGADNFCSRVRDWERRSFRLAVSFPVQASGRTSMPRYRPRLGRCLRRRRPPASRTCP